MWYMGLNKNGLPNGWTQDNPPAGYIEVSDTVRLIHELNPTYVWDGTTLVAPVIPPPPLLSREQIIYSLTASVQHYLDGKPQERFYDGILSLCTYANSLNATFRAEGQAGVEWRDAVWATCWEVMAEVDAGTRPVPTEAELLSLLPELVWPI